MSDTSDFDRQFPTGFMGIHDKTPDMRIIYVTSSIRQVLGFEPSDVVGQTALTFIENGNADEYKEHFGEHSNDDSVLVTQVYIRANASAPVHIKLVSFSCDSLAFNVCFVRSDTPPTLEHSPMRIELVRGSGLDETSRQQSLLAAQRERNRRATIVSGGRSIRACLTLDYISERAENPMGPRILFASNSFDRIINADASDIQGLPFLLLVAPEDVAKAGRFLDKIKSASTIIIEHLLLLVNPLEESTGGERTGPRAVAVEIMAAGADSGAIMLCQLARVPISSIGEQSDGYMSLEDIISSDPDTSDVGGMWNDVAF
ncbi:hypothetical protein IWW57_002534 [Coemansia sp. S610]|nr:hypothetical protein IWW57_002534 [Coemansia sp. S610]KAJ2390192.1 hypothetical protein H4S02_001989 [Coemansia sp. RSA 2611]